jgi:iron(III) transport system permease protein
LQDTLCFDPVATCRTGWRQYAPRLRWRLDGWQILVAILSLFVLLPLMALLLFFLHPQKEIWQHLATTLLSELVVNTAVLSTGVAFGTAVIGVMLAWLVGTCDFPGRKFFAWALVLPMAIPAYVLAFVAMGLLDYTGPIQTFLRGFWPASRTWFPNVRSAGGVIGVMTLTLYPYVYLLAKSAFETQGKRALEAARALGLKPVAGFFKVALPMARPWIAAGVMLVLMETLADFGAVSVFNFNTFTTAIYKSWFGFFSLPAAAQLSSVLVGIALLVLLFEQFMQRKMRFTQSGRLSMESTKVRLRRTTGWLACLFCSAVLMLAFAIPVIQLSLWVLSAAAEEFSIRYAGLIGRSLLLALAAMGLITSASLALAYVWRSRSNHLTRLLIRLTTLGYAVPGTVLAVGIFLVASSADRWLVEILPRSGGLETGSLLGGSVFALLAAYMVRYMAAGYHPVHSAMNRLTKHLDEAAASMGVTGLALLHRVHIPILRSGLITAAIMVFVDVLKEMPITLMLRPFGWDTLAVKIFELTAEGQWERAALPALVLVMAGLLPVLLLTRKN